MSDDLERAALCVARAKDCGGLVGGEFTLCSDVRRGEREKCDCLNATSAALLSFLDMDEAGVERLAGAMFEAHPAWASTSADARPIKWEHVRDTDASHYWKDKARAVLAELRKMAGEKEPS